MIFECNVRLLAWSMRLEVGSTTEDAYGRGVLRACHFDLASPWGIPLIRTPAAGRLFGHQFALCLRLPNQSRKVPSSSVDEPVADLFIGYNH